MTFIYEWIAKFEFFSTILFNSISYRSISFTISEEAPILIFARICLFLHFTSLIFYISLLYVNLCVSRFLFSANSRGYYSSPYFPFVFRRDFYSGIDFILSSSPSSAFYLRLSFPPTCSFYRVYRISTEGKHATTMIPASSPFSLTASTLHHVAPPVAVTMTLIDNGDTRSKIDPCVIHIIRTENLELFTDKMLFFSRERIHLCFFF